MDSTAAGSTTASGSSGGTSSRRSSLRNSTETHAANAPNSSSLKRKRGAPTSASSSGNDSSNLDREEASATATSTSASHSSPVNGTTAPFRRSLRSRWVGRCSFTRIANRRFRLYDSDALFPFFTSFPTAPETSNSRAARPRRRERLRPPALQLRLLRRPNPWASAERYPHPPQSTKLRAQAYQRRL